MTTILAIDTSSKYPSIAVSIDDKIASSYNFTSKNDLSSILIPSMEMVLINLGITFSDINAIGLTVGPGIFTGIRVGLSTVKGLIFDCEKPVIPIYSTTAIAHKCKEKIPEVISLIDARRNEVYVSKLQLSSINYLETAPELINISELSELTTNSKNKHFTGIGAIAHQEYLEKNFVNCTILKTSPWLAESTAYLAADLFSRGCYTTDPTEILPCYIRKPDAEANYNK